MQVRLRKKNQLTIPAAIAHSANIKTDDMLEIDCRNGEIILTPKSEKQRTVSIMSYAGIGRGVWEHTTDEIAKTIANRFD
ncbi:AbrB/MazE/SpoVT family DNA-binding domain-containing protein [Chlorobaculum thiosulfatiphilum]|uniref:AbrB/MazE/SpoVT family DNA-binding domain-containing protein n=1 Tax=Chlorobaculum thiosulfatiphilum TaxID=115852 RepID=A0A5C4RZB9_CHLTI|nr:AbrB/MazE/SpoVT family DNA-binding domain-containing protein [Chlorobaculum thiosulfatiphilum]TNJ36279.1 AbrB/MazE/SpoVT family DNA-binding domain-containing protein [Chlorobaculum thiosulfatiphilum]